MVESPQSQNALSLDELQDAWPVLSARSASRASAAARDGRGRLLPALTARDQAELVLGLPGERRSWMRLLPRRRGRPDPGGAGPRSARACWRCSTSRRARR